MSKYFVPPYNRYTVVEVEQAQEMRTAGGLILPEMAKADKSDVCQWRVVAVGPGAWGHNGQREPLQWKVGDVLLAHKASIEHQSYRHPETGELCVVLLEGDVLGGPAPSGKQPDPRTR